MAKASSKNESVGRFAYDGLDRVIHEKARLSVLTSLVAHPKGLVFGDLKHMCGLTDGNLSRHLQVLEEAGLVDIEKGYDRNRPQTVVRITAQGRARRPAGHASGAGSRRHDPLTICILVRQLATAARGSERTDVTAAALPRLRAAGFGGERNSADGHRPARPVAGRFEDRDRGRRAGLGKGREAQSADRDRLFVARRHHRYGASFVHRAGAVTRRLWPD